MSLAWVRRESAGRLRVSGELVFESVMDILDDPALDASDLAEEVVVDLSGVERADSSAMALLMEWCQRLAARKIRMRVASLPTGVCELIDLGGMEDLLPGAN